MKNNLIKQLTGSKWTKVSLPVHQMTEDRKKRWALVNLTTNSQVQYKAVNFTSWASISSWRSSLFCGVSFLFEKSCEYGMIFTYSDKGFEFVSVTQMLHVIFSVCNPETGYVCNYDWPSRMCCHVAMYEGVIASGDPVTSIFRLNEQLSHSNDGPIIGFQLCSIYIITELCWMKY